MMSFTKRKPRHLVTDNQRSGWRKAKHIYLTGPADLMTEYQNT